MSLTNWLILSVASISFLSIWQRSMGLSLLIVAFITPFGMYLWAGLSLRTYAWSWALPLAAGLIVTMPAVRYLYVALSRKANGWGPFTMEIEDSKGHLHYVKRIDQGTYINGGSGSGKTISCNAAYARHAVRFGMPMLVHDLKRYELSEVLYPICNQKGIDYYVFALFDPGRSVRINPIAPEYIPDEASLRARVKSFILAVQGREGSDSTADFFNNASASLLESLIWYLRRYEPQYCNLPFVMALVNNSDNLHLKKGNKVIPFGKLELMLKRDAQISSMAGAFFQGAGNANTTSNILQTVILALNTINTDAGFFLLSANDMNLRINRSGCSEVLALVNDPRNSTAYAPILAMVADATLTMMSERDRDPAVALLDEAPELPILRVQNYMATLRSLGICIVYTTQDMSQIQRTQDGKEYNMRTVLSNLAHQFMGRTTSEPTAKYYEGLMPHVERVERSYSSSSSGSSVSRRKVKKPLYERTEFFKLCQGEFVYFHGAVERFRFQYQKIRKNMPPKIREISTEQMHQIAESIRQEAVDFMNRFQ